MKIDYISDLHLDSWFSYRGKNPKSIFKSVRPVNVSKVLLIGGDLGHDNDLSLKFLSLAADVYEKVAFVTGNHEFYLFGKKNEKFGRQSIARVNDLKERSMKIQNVEFLDGTTFTIDDVTIGGCGMWYDGKYATIQYGIYGELLRSYWMSTMNDARLIHGMGEMHEIFENEYKKMSAIIDDCDVFLSHVGPDWSRVSPRFHSPSTGFFYFDGHEILKKCKGKSWVYGHTHDRAQFINSYGCHMLCNPLGYPGENFLGEILSFDTLDAITNE